MGQEIHVTGFKESDFTDFRNRLELETASLRDAFANKRLSGEGPRVGLELEAWLIDRNCFPVPDNQSFLARLGDSSVVAELSRFNVEINVLPRLLREDGLPGLENDLASALKRCIEVAHQGSDTVMAIGTLPTLREVDLSLSNMTPSNRYVALNRELIKARGGAPLRIEIDSASPDGAHLRTTHLDVMLEAATTSLQLHYQVPADRFSSVFNASVMLSAPLVAISANSPFLFDHALWHESRITIFEQALEQAQAGVRQRVTFGSGYAGEDPTRLFLENLDEYPVLLPVIGEHDADRLSCVRLHNGTIWRWNRPLVGFDEDGTPHMRIEHRIMPAGPSVIDMMANAALYYGAAHMLAEQLPDAEAALPFAKAQENFYAAAKLGLDAEIVWLDGRTHAVRDVIAELIPIAREGLHRQGVSEELAGRYLDVIALRLASGRNGATWQLAHHARHRDLFRLTADYLEHQRSGMPVHEWPI